MTEKGVNVETAKLYKDLFNILYDVYNSKIELPYQIDFFYIVRQMLQGEKFVSVDRLSEKLANVKEKDETEKLLSKFCEIVKKGENLFVEKPASCKKSLLEGFNEYIKAKFINETKGPVGHVYATEKRDFRYPKKTDSPLLNEESEEYLDSLRINVLLAMGEEVNREIEEYLASINEVVRSFKISPVRFGESQYRELLDYCYTMKETKHFSEGLATLKEKFERKRLAKNLDSERSKKFFKLLKILSKDEMLKLSEFAKKEYVSFMNIDSEILSKLLQDNGELQPFLNFYKLSEDYLKNIDIDDFKFSTKDVVLGMYRMKDSKKEREDYQEIFDLIAEHVRKQDEKIQNRQGVEYTFPLLGFSKKKNLLFDKLAFATNCAEFIKTGMLARRDSEEIVFLSKENYEKIAKERRARNGYLNKLETIHQDYKGRLKRLEKEFDWSELEAKEYLITYIDLIDKNYEKNNYIEFLKEQHDKNLAEESQWLEEHYAGFKLNTHKENQGRFVIDTGYSTINARNLKKKNQKIWGGYAGITDYSLGKEQMIDDKPVIKDGIAVKEGENVPCIVMGLLIENDYLTIPGGNDIFIHVTKEIGNSKGLYNIEFSIVPCGKVTQRIQVGRLENTNGVVPHTNRGGDTIKSTTHWHWYTEFDRVLAGGDSGDYVISENFAENQLSFEEALDEFLGKVQIELYAKSDEGEKEKTKYRNYLKQLILGAARQREDEIIGEECLYEEGDYKESLLKKIEEWQVVQRQLIEKRKIANISKEEKLALLARDEEEFLGK